MNGVKMPKVYHLEVRFWRHNPTNKEMADLVKEISGEIRMGKRGEVVSGVKYVSGATWRVW